MKNIDQALSGRLEPGKVAVEIVSGLPVPKGHDDEAEFGEAGPRIAWATFAAAEYLSELDERLRCDVVVLRHNLHRIDRALLLGKLVPRIKEHLREGGLLGVELFDDDDAPIVGAESFCSADEVMDIFPSWQIVEEATGPATTERRGDPVEKWRREEPRAYVILRTTSRKESEGSSS